ncbi:MAG TPA: hypothetical protein VF703_06920 [Pyrinomonadaceae bacterium]|jgi:hypothetical protein
MDEAQRLELCIKEIEIAQESIARYDENGSNIKNWCVTTWSAVSAYAIGQRETAIALIGIALVIGFSLVELTYRRFQKRFIGRAAEIEDMLESGDLRAYRYSIHKCAATRCEREIRSVLLLPHFIIFYVVLIIFSVVAAFYCWKYPILNKTT